MGVITSYNPTTAPSSQTQKSHAERRSKRSRNSADCRGSAARPSPVCSRSGPGPRRCRHSGSPNPAPPSRRPGIRPPRARWSTGWCRTKSAGTGGRLGDNLFFRGENSKKTWKSTDGLWQLCYFTILFSLTKKTQMLMSNSLAQTRGGLQYPNNNPVACSCACTYAHLEPSHSHY